MNIQRINQGTHEMVTKMLVDLGLPEVSFEKWTTRRFITNYLADDLDSEDWEDIWTETWEIEVKTAALVQWEASDIDLTRTRAYDDTWQGDPMPMPIECVLVADFYSTEAIAHAVEILEGLERIRAAPSLLDVLAAQVPKAPDGLFHQIREDYLIQQLVPTPLSLRQRAGRPLQLLIFIGAIDENFFLAGAKPALLIANLCETLGGTTTWEDRTSPEHLD